MSLIEWRRDLAWNGPLVTLLGLTIAAAAGIAIVGLSTWEGIALFGVVAVVIAALIEPFVGLAAGLLLGPLKAYLSAEVPEIPAQIGHVFIALALGSWLVNGLSRREIRIPDPVGSLSNPVLLSLLAFCGAALLSLWDAVGLVAYGVPEFIKWLEMVLLLIFVQQRLAQSVVPGAGEESRAGLAPKTVRLLRWLVVVLFAGGFFQALIGLWQFGARGEGPEHFRILGGQFFRAYGTFEQPNPYAGYLGLIAALAMGTVAAVIWDRVLRGGRGLARVEDSGQLPASTKDAGWGFVAFGGGCAAAMLAALLASWSRGAWLGFAAATVAMATALPRKRVTSIVLVSTLVVAAFGIYGSGLLPASFTERLTSFVRDIRLEDVRGVPINDMNYAVIERLAHWQAAVSMTRHDLWTGVGLGCYEAAYPTFSLINWPNALGHAHNIYLNLLAETGLIGLVTYLTLWAVVVWQTWMVTRRGRGLTRAIAVGALGAWVHVTVHHLLDNLYVNNVHLHLGVLLGLVAFLAGRAHGQSSANDR